MPLQGKHWYLGIDLGTVGISAALLNSKTGQTHRIVWQTVGQDGALMSVLRLPAIAYLSNEELSGTPTTPSAVGDRALKAKASVANQGSDQLLLSDLRQSLSIAIPYRSSQTQTWEPILQWSDTQTVSLAWVQQAIVALLATLKEQSGSCTAQGLSPDEFQAVLAELAGVIVGCPTGWSDTYCFNLREAVLVAELVAQPEHIFFIEDAIAVLLSELPATSEATPETKTFQATSPDRRQTLSLQGNTLVLNAGAVFTELLLVDLPSDPQTLNREDLYLRSVAYAGNAINQDIICQLLYPSVWGWRNLGSPSLDLPLPGEPDLPTRYLFQQRLRSSDLGQNLVRIAKQLKMAFQQEDATTFNISESQWTVTQQEFHSRVIAPYIQLINREINTLLTQAGIAAQAVRHVLCAGGTASNPAIAHWLKQKFPSAVLHQDASNSIAFSSRVAFGLAKLPLYPQLLDAVRHQYSDYFLLQKLLKILPNEPLPLVRILQLLEAQGVNIQICQQAVLNLLEGQLPAGLVPSKTDFALLSPESKQNADYQALKSTPVFLHESNQVYRFNPDLRHKLQQYLSTILSETHQTLEEALPLDLGIDATI